MTVHDEDVPGNGDPIVVVPVFHDNALSAEKLGTGFSSWDQVASEIAHAVKTGETTQNIPASVCRNLHESKPEEVHLFSLAGRVEFSATAVGGGE